MAAGEEPFEIALLIECSDEGLVNEVERQFGNENVSSASNFIGGASIAVFLVASLKSLQPMVKNILDFLSQRSERYDNATVVYDGKKVTLKGYGPDEVEKILTHPAFEKLRKDA